MQPTDFVFFCDAHLGGEGWSQADLNSRNPIGTGLNDWCMKPCEEKC